MVELNSVQPYGQTPITGAVQEAAKVLRYRERPAVIVLLTDGEETCGGNPCALAQMLKRDGADLTVHVIGYMTGHTSGMPARYATRCLPEQTGGLYITTETTDELAAALQKTLGCALLSGLDAPGSARQHSSRWQGRVARLARSRDRASHRRTRPSRRLRVHRTCRAPRPRKGF